MIDAAVLESTLSSRLHRNTKVKQKGELCFSDCPNCGHGEDRFWVNPSTETFWCRHCEYSGWVVDLLVDHFGMSKDQAIQTCGKHLEDNHQFYVYKDENGRPLFEVHAVRKPGEPKKVWQRLPGGVKAAIRPELRVPYNMKAAMESQRVYVVEGEKKVEIMRKFNLVATTNSMGAGKFGTCSEDSIKKVFKGKDVVIIPDNDDPGRAHARDVADRLQGISKVVRICPLPNLEEKEGLDDFVLKYGNEKFMETLRSVILAAQPYTAGRHFQTLIEYTSREEEAPAPIVQGILEKGEGTLIAAEYGQMKSLFRLQLAIHIASGRDFLGRKVPKPLTVGIFQWENSEHLERKRIRNMLQGLGIKPNEVADIIRLADKKERFNLIQPEDKARLLQRCKEIEADVFMFDNLSNMHLSDENDNIKMRSIVDTLSDINTKLGTSCVLIHHMSKPSENRALRHRIRGAISLQDWASNILTLSPVHTEDGRIVKALRFEKVRDPDESFQEETYVEFDREKWCFIPTTVKLSIDGMVKLVYQAGQYSTGDLKRVLMKEYRITKRNADMMIETALKDGKLLAARGNRNGKILTVSTMTSLVMEGGNEPEEEVPF